MCPTEAWRDNTLQSRRWRDDLFRVSVEFDIYRIAVGRWNKYVRAHDETRTHEEYLAYLLDFYDGLAGIRESEGEENWDLMSEWWGTLRVEGVGPLVDTSIEAGEWSPVIDMVNEVAQKTIERVVNQVHTMIMIIKIIMMMVDQVAVLSLNPPPH